MNWQIMEGDCLEVLRKLEMNSIDSLITDPPAGISFMGKAWDQDKGGRKQWIAWMAQVMSECLRVMKPGAHGLVWAIPRTSHWTATALEDAGFEIRDVVTHLFGSGFPKSLDVSKAIDKAAGAEREVIGTVKRSDKRGGRMHACADLRPQIDHAMTAPATDAAKQWQGWGTALKPASEHWILVRKPCSEKTVAANALKWGCGAINIDASRIEATDQAMLDAAVRRMTGNQVKGNSTENFVSGCKTIQPNSNQGRFPANLILSCSPYCTEESHDIECAIAEIDRQSGILRSHGGGTVHATGYKPGQDHTKGGKDRNQKIPKGDSGGASRFFYVAKASKADKGADNTHPTVKSSKLMSYLITLVTPPGGTVLDPFSGSGSTGVAALKSGFKFIGIEQEQEYFSIAKMRCLNALEQE